MGKIFNLVFVHIISFRVARAHKERKARAGWEECTERVTAMEVFSKGIVVSEATTNIKNYGRRWLERRWCAKKSLKTLPIDKLGLWKRKDLSKSMIRHLPQKLSQVCSLFWWQGGTKECTVTGHRNYSVDLAQDRLEAPCSLLFKETQLQVWALSASTWNRAHYNLHRNGLIICCRKIRCRKYFVRLIFIALCDFKNFPIYGTI